jgi:uncharacterized damage-inducible protein DinB
MFTRALLIDLLRHMEWADAKVWAAVPEASPPDPRLAELLVHIHVVQRAFFMVWTGGDVSTAFRSAADFPSLAELRDWAQAYYQPAHSFVNGLADWQLDAVVAMPWAAQVQEQLGRPPGSTSIGETCVQVASHSTYHRGQVNVRLRELGAEPPLVDYIAWLWFGRPAAEWNR